MATRCWAIAAVLLGGCAVHAPIHADGPPVKEELVVPADRVALGRAAAEALDARMAKGDCQALVDVFQLAPDAGFLARQQCQGLTAPIHTRIDPLYPLGPGFMADALVNGVALGELYFGPGNADAWQITIQPPTTEANLVPPLLLSEKAELDLFPGKRALAGDVLATVKGAAPVLEFEFDGHRILEVSQDGAPCRFRTVGKRLLIEPVHPGDEVTLRIRFEGEPPEDHPASWRKHKSLVLALPRLEHTWAKFEVHAKRPAGYSLFGQGQEVGTTSVGETDQTRWKFEGSSFSLLGGTGYSIHHSHSIEDVELVIATFEDEDPGAGTRLAVLAHQAFAALSPLGHYPSPTLRMVVMPEDQDFQRAPLSSFAIGQWALKNPDPELATLLAADIGQGWYGGTVPGRDGFWPVVMGLYLSQWMDSDVALHLRRKVSGTYAAMDSEKDIPILSLSAGTPPAVQEAVVGKALLMMVAIEDKLGPDRLLRELKRFLAARAGQNSGWDDLAEVMRVDVSPDMGDWLRNFVRTTGAPHVRLTEAHFGGGFAWGNLVIDEGDPIAWVEVGFWRNGKLVGEGKIPFHKGVTPIRVPIPPGAEVLVMDPRFRIPRRYDPAADAVTAGSEVPLPRW